MFIIRAFRRLFLSVWETIRDPESSALLALVIALLGLGTVVYHHYEGWRYFDSLYFSVTTLTTVGLGDFSPTTDAAKIFTIVYIFIGLGVILSFINLIARHAQNQNEELIENYRQINKKIKHKINDLRK